MFQYLDSPCTCPAPLLRVIGFDFPAFMATGVKFYSVQCLETRFVLNFIWQYVKQKDKLQAVYYSGCICFLLWQILTTPFQVVQP